MWDELYFEDGANNAPLNDNGNAISLLVDTRMIKSQTEDCILQNREKLKTTDDSDNLQFLAGEIAKLEKLNADLKIYLEKLEYFANIEKVYQTTRQQRIDPKDYITIDQKTLHQALLEKEDFLARSSPLDKCDHLYMA